MKVRTWFGCVVLITGVACGSEDSDNDDQDGTNSSALVTNPADSRVQAYCADGAAITCATLAPCCPMDETTCLSQETARCTTQMQEALSHGMGYDPAKGNSCLQLMPQSYSECTIVANAAGPCLTMVVGATALGASCEDVYQCPNTPEHPVGCVSQTETGARVCTELAILGLGEDCSNPDQGACAAGTYCDTSGSAPLCAAAQPAGGACSTLLECANGLSCLGGQCTLIELSDLCEMVTGDD